jgi:acyl carrier protein
MKDDKTKTAEDIKKLLAEQLGVEVEDLSSEDMFGEDLHMDPSALTDFIGTLEAQGFDISKIELTEIQTLGDLLEELGLE